MEEAVTYGAFVGSEHYKAVTIPKTYHRAPPAKL